ncbi:hypothetical protein FALBO_13240 [Fusarium albosuccineum]|uniref:Uncharacterized protein n=1 Tax=Fusarium albosuccineum TaxID=1237068 RepID=A0A8H4P7A3_9HYPO|nr:hypothetical protein FALBO_13240 [Fusarium albosuccineum]
MRHDFNARALFFTHEVSGLKKTINTIKNDFKKDLYKAERSLSAAFNDSIKSITTKQEKIEAEIATL